MTEIRYASFARKVLDNSGLNPNAIDNACRKIENPIEY